MPPQPVSVGAGVGVISVRSPRLAALTAAAMALPGVHARAAEPGLNPFTVDASHLEYFESGNRMRVRVNQGTATVPIGDNIQLLANGLQDVISGASPINNAPGPGGSSGIAV